MALRTKTLLSIVLILSSVLLTMFATSRSVLRSRFADIQRHNAEAESKRAVAVMESMLDEVDAVCRDRASSATYAETAMSSDVAKVVVGQDVYETYKLDFCGVFTPSGELV